MTATCSLCGVPLAPDARFCTQCGTPVTPAAEATPPSPDERPAGPYERPAPNGDEEYYPEDFPDHLSADTGRQVMAGATYPTEPPAAYGPPAYGSAGYLPPGYGPPDDALRGDEPTYAAGGFAGRDEELADSWEEPDGPRSRVLLVGGAVLVGFLVLIGLVYFLLFRPGSSPTAALPSSSPSASAQGASTSPSVTGSTPSAVTTPAPSQSAYPAVTLPAGSTVCPTGATGAYAHVAAGNTSTSCEFATAVRAAYTPVAAPGTSVVVQATSPRTGKSYGMTCSGDQPVVCTGGNNAQVILYGGTPTAP